MGKQVIHIILSSFLLCIWGVTELSAQIPTENLVAHYPFDGNANDITGNGYDAVNTNALLTTDRFGSENSAYEFNGHQVFVHINLLTQ